MEILSCNAPYNEGGLGKVLAQLVEEVRADGRLGCYYTSRRKSNDSQGEEPTFLTARWREGSPLQPFFTAFVVEPNTVLSALVNLSTNSSFWNPRLHT